jgi:hypothetical protein
MSDRKNALGVEEYNDDFGENFRRIERAPVVSSSVFENEELRGFFDWWRSQATKPPRRVDFDVIDHWRLAPNFFFLRVIDPETFEVILVGETVIQLVGRNQTGRRFCVDDGDPPLRIFARYLQTVVETRQCWRCSGNLTVFERGHVQFESMDCPLTDSNGTEITHVIGMMARL